MQVEYDSVDDAIEQVKLGNTWAAIHVGETFTNDLLTRVCAFYPDSCPPEYRNVTNETIPGSAIYIHADVTSMAR